MPERPAPFRPTLLLVVLSLVACAAVTPGCAQGGLSASEQREAERILEVIELREGEVVADVGAGDGEWSVPLARRVGPGGRVYVTEVRQSLLDEARELFAAEGLANASFVLGDERRTGLEPGCCDVLFLRKVYHHFTDPAAMADSLYRALRPGGRLVLVEYTDHLASRVEGVPENRSGHGLAAELLEAELTAAGFELVTLETSWMDRDNEYCAVFRRP